MSNEYSCTPCYFKMIWQQKMQTGVRSPTYIPLTKVQMILLVISCTALTSRQLSTCDIVAHLGNSISNIKQTSHFSNVMFLVSPHDLTCLTNSTVTCEIKPTLVLLSLERLLFLFYLLLYLLCIMTNSLLSDSRYRNSHEPKNSF